MLLLMKAHSQINWV